MKLNNILVMGKSGAGKQPRIEVLCKEFGLEQLSTGNIFREYLGKFNNSGYNGSLEDFWDKDKNWFLADSKIKEILKKSIESKNLDYDDIVLGLKAKYFIEKGLFVPDEITNELFASYFSRSNYRNKVLDGYPRTLPQAKFLLELVKKHQSSIDLIVLVDNDDKTIIERTTGRRICSNPACAKVYHLKYKPPKDGKYCIECGAEVIQRSDDTEGKIISRLNEFHTKTEPAIEYLKNENIPIAIVPGNLKEFSEEAVYQSVMDAVKKALGIS